MLTTVYIPLRPTRCHGLRHSCPPHEKLHYSCQRARARVTYYTSSHNVCMPHAAVPPKCEHYTQEPRHTLACFYVCTSVSSCTRALVHSLLQSHCQRAGALTGACGTVNCAPDSWVRSVCTSKQKLKAPVIRAADALLVIAVRDESARMNDDKIYLYIKYDMWRHIIHMLSMRASLSVCVF